MTTAQPRIGTRSRSGTFGTLKQIAAGVLNTGYAEAGVPRGPVVILLHGWPYDIHSFIEVAPRLASAGYRVIVPHLRGYGTTRFRSSDTFRNGKPSALATDVIELMDVLQIRQAILAGFDWGDPAPTPRSSRVGTNTGSSRAASGTTYRRRRRRNSPTPSSPWLHDGRRGGG